MSIVASKAISNSLSGITLTFPTREQLTIPDLKSKEEVKIQSKVTSNVATISKVKEDTTSRDVTPSHVHVQN